MILSVTPTIARFLRSRAYVRILKGPRGEGKTTGMYGALLYETISLPPEVLPLRAIIVRDTWTNLERTTIDTLRELQQKGVRVRLFDDDRQAIIGDRVHVFFVGIDTTKDLNKLQGFGAGVLVIEEPAPAADISGGVSSEVFGIGVSSLRQQGVRHGVIIPMNPPDEEHWTETLPSRIREVQRQYRLAGTMDVEVFNIPPGENPHITQEQRDINRVALEAIGRGDLVSRLVLGRTGFVVLGERVTPEYSDDLHLAKGPLPILEHVTVIRSWDFGLHPTCIWSQISPLGHWHILGAVVGPNLGLEQLIDLYVKPWEARYLGDPDLFRFRDIGDPAGTQREQSNSERSAVRTMLALLPGASFEPGPVEWEERKQAIKAILGRNIRGRAVVQVDPEAKAVRNALRGGAHYPKDGLGRVTPTLEAMKKASGIHSHPFDAMCYGAARLFPVGTGHGKKAKPLPPRVPVPAAQRWMAV